jgi:alpha-galactosidase
VLKGKPALPGLPATFGTEKDVMTLVVHLYDKYSEVRADLMYSIFPKYDAIVRSVSVTNKGKGTISIEALSSMSVDLPYEEFDMIGLRGDWAREAHRQRRKVDYGIQGYDHIQSIRPHYVDSPEQFREYNRILISLTQPLRRPGASIYYRVPGRGMGLFTGLHRLLCCQC